MFEKMKILNQLFAKFAMVTLLLGAVVSFSSCDKDEDTPQINYYSMGFDSFSSSSSTFLAELSEVEDAFQEQLGVDYSTFSLEGSSSECDAKVKAACALAEASLSETVFTSTFVYVVNNVTTDETVYTYSK